ncbi:hypothetical protein [Aliterella atlantica]|uniref:hypothetical protein n=1 Tax=Aliterella atlantica TaxID=1827278 RepID=UPI0030DB4B7F
MTNKLFTMHKLITTGLIALDTIMLLVLPLQTQEVKANSSCTATVSAAQNRIETRRNVRVITRISDVSELYPDHPTARPHEYELLLEGAASESIMNSPKFIKSIAAKIITNCNSVGSVTFGVNQTGWSYSVGLIQGKVQFFECLDYDGSDRKLNWGEQYCSL